MYIRKITRKWKNRDGKETTKSYYYWYRSIRLGDKVISECLGKATEEEYQQLQEKRREANARKEAIFESRPKVRRV